MLRTRILLVVISAILIWLLFLLPKAVVENESDMATADSAMVNTTPMSAHGGVSSDILQSIREARVNFFRDSQNEKSSIFADSLRSLYTRAGQFDSAAWFAEQSASFLKSPTSYLNAGNSYYEAYTFAIDPAKQKQMALKTREYLEKVIESDPQNLEAKTKIALTYLSTDSPMKGITLLREVLAEDPKNEFALFNMGMLSIQSGQYQRAVERLNELVAINPNHLQGQLLLGVALMNTGDKKGARAQFEKVKQLDNDPSVQATADSYLKDLK